MSKRRNEKMGKNIPIKERLEKQNKTNRRINHAKNKTIKF